MTTPLHPALSAGILFGAVAATPALPAASFSVTKQSRDRGSGELHQVTEPWEGSAMAVVICDMWDSHHSANAARRTAELAPAIDALAKAAREAGALVIHAPSSCMAPYEDSPARARARSAPAAPNLPGDIGSWCRWIDGTEESTGYPIDDSDGGEDDDPAALAKWHAELEGQGRDPRAPWQRQVDTITIDHQRDAITDSGSEVWNLLHARGIDNVVLAGVHTNMCVLGRPFGLRQLAKNGKNVVLARDLTDTMYNPARRPQVSHFHGTDLVVAHIERHVCPTITSDQITGAAPFRFADDPRPTLLVAIGEDEYETGRTVPAFAENHLADSFRLEFALADPADPDSFPAIGLLDHADLLFVSVRRRALPETQLAAVRRHVADGKPVVGIRTASHAFALRDKEPPDGKATWPGFDAEVLGGNYQGHHGNGITTTVTLSDANHPLTEPLKSGTSSFPSPGSLYKNHPLHPGATILATGKADGIEMPEPVAWTRTTPAGGRVFYTSLGHPGDFDQPGFVALLEAACAWAAAH
jgi:type 1 glutamine amidotransferase/nicotinamidase-related amidase